MAPPKLKFGDNTISFIGKGIFIINFVNGGEWTFDVNEIDKLDSIVKGFQTEWVSLEQDLPRTKGGSAHFENVLGYIHIHQKDQDARFLGCEMNQLRDAIKRLKP